MVFIKIAESAVPVSIGSLIFMATIYYSLVSAMYTVSAVCLIFCSCLSLRNKEM
ncbi:hypothetical protein Fmac_029104 [Flemingia macrophylla]|uniref:Uncharacterized protein n=1 Tax=Flemingia macrophylla TaxID=520843 RepID=A0ABD1LAV0_9FABA